VSYMTASVTTEVGLGAAVEAVAIGAVAVEGAVVIDPLGVSNATEEERT